MEFWIECAKGVCEGCVCCVRFACAECKEANERHKSCRNTKATQKKTQINVTEAVAHFLKNLKSNTITAHKLT
jgi:hypothetical protein